MRQRKKNTIQGFEVSPGSWRIRVNGKLHPSTFVSRKDIELWYLNMTQNGLYTGFELTFLG